MTMRFIKTLCMFIAITILSTTFAVTTTSGADLKRLENVFKSGVQNVSIMQIKLSSEDTKKSKIIQDKMMKSINNNMVWYTEYTQKYIDSNEAIEWHKNFGITKEEFNYLMTIDQKMKFLEDSKTKLKISKTKSGNLVITNNKLLPNISNMELDIKNNAIVTKYGKLEYSSSFKATDNQKLTGRWSGNTWRLNFESLSSMAELSSLDMNKRYGYIEISIGKMESTGKILIVYNEKIIYQGKSSSLREMITLNN